MTKDEFADLVGIEYADEYEKAQLSQEGTTKDAISEQPDVPNTNVGDINKFIDGLEEMFADIRERHVDDSVCGLCEYDGAYVGQSGDWCNECPGFDKDDCFKLSDKTRKKWTEEIIKALPSVQPEERTKTHAETHACDLISRQAAIDGKISIQCANGVEIYSDEAVPVEYLKALQPAQPELKWIPCGETVDIPDHEVMACDRYGEFIIGYLDCKDEQWLCESDSSLMYDPVAWRELPEPYKEGGAERRTE